MKLKIGITGQNGFIGKHLCNTLRLFTNSYEIINFNRSFFADNIKLENFVSQCDVIIHLAALNRDDDEKNIYKTNVFLVKRLINAIEKTNSKPHIIFSSSSQENSNNFYAKSKIDGRGFFEQWAIKNNTKFSGLIIPNVFGPFSKPFYNTVIATFSYQVIKKDIPKIINDTTVSLIYISELIDEIIKIINGPSSKFKIIIKPTFNIKVSDILKYLQYFNTIYYEKGELPILSNRFEINLFNTYRSFINNKVYFPRELTLHSDQRGSFIEMLRLGLGGQVSFSTTHANIVRGNHFHTRKIERFIVIKGKAMIEMRQIGTEKKFSFILDGEKPSYVDMPIWYTHNIKNIGNEDLYTVFWINETYNSEDADTYFENV